MRSQPYPTVLKPYGQALLELGRQRPDVICISGDLTRQTEIDLFQDSLPLQFVHAGMAEANMMSVAGALARRGHIPFVHTFGVFATRRPLDQIVNSIAYPNLPVRIVGFMPGISSPGGPSHQAIEDVALMRSIPNMTVIDVADAVEIKKVVPAIVDLPGPVYLRLKRGEIPVIFDDYHEFSLTKAQVLRTGSDVALIANGMMLSSAIAAADALESVGIRTTVVNAPVIKPFDSATVLSVARNVRAVITVENHSIIGGLGSAVAEVMAEGGSGVPLRRVGLQDTFAEGSKTAPPLFHKYGLNVQGVIDQAWMALSLPGSSPRIESIPAAEGEYSPV